MSFFLMSIITIAAAVVPTGPFRRKKTGTLRSAPVPKQTSCLLVKLKRTFVFTDARSFDTVT